MVTFHCTSRAAGARLRARRLVGESSVQALASACENDLSDAFTWLIFDKARLSMSCDHHSNPIPRANHVKRLGVFEARRQCAFPVGPPFVRLPVFGQSLGFLDCGADGIVASALPLQQASLMNPQFRQTTG